MSTQEQSAHEVNNITRNYAWGHRDKTLLE